MKAQIAQVLGKFIKRRVIKLVPLKGQPRVVTAGPHLSPLSFHADGSLLLLTTDGLVRSAPDGRFEYDASSEVDAWSTTLVSPGGDQLRGVAFPCDRSEVSWLASSPRHTCPSWMNRMIWSYGASSASGGRRMRGVRSAPSAFWMLPPA